MVRAMARWATYRVADTLPDDTEESVAGTEWHQEASGDAADKLREGGRRRGTSWGVCEQVALTGLRHADVAGPAPTPRRYAFFSDTLYTPALAPLIHGADLLYHEATFLEDLRERAAQTHHSTARQAALLAEAAGVKRLLLGHFSSRYKTLEPLLHEAHAVFPTAELATEGLLVSL